MTPSQREDGMGEMTESEAKENIRLWDERCDWSAQNDKKIPGDKHHKEMYAKALISKGYLAGLEQGRKESGELVEALEHDMHCVDCAEAAHENCSDCRSEKVLDSYRQHRTGKGG